MPISTAKRVLIFSILIFLFFVSGFSIPVIGIFFLPFSSVSLVLLFIKNGILTGLIGILLSSLAIYKIVPTGYIFLFPFSLFVVLNSVVLYYGIIKKNNPWRITLESCFIVSITSLVLMLSLNIGDPQTSGMVSKIVSDIPKEKLDIIFNVIMKNIYAIAVIFIMMNVFLSYIFLSFTAPKFNITLKKLPSFEKWRIPENVIFILIFSILFYLIGYRFKHNTLSQLFENLLYLLFFIYFIGGISIGKYLFSKSRMAIFIVYLVFFLYPPLAVLLGISDVWFDFRKRRRNKENDISVQDTEDKI